MRVTQCMSKAQQDFKVLCLKSESSRHPVQQNSVLKNLERNVYKLLRARISEEWHKEESHLEKVITIIQVLDPNYRMLGK